MTRWPIIVTGNSTDKFRSDISADAPKLIRCWWRCCSYAPTHIPANGDEFHFGVMILAGGGASDAKSCFLAFWLRWLKRLVRGYHPPAAPVTERQ